MDRHFERLDIDAEFFYEAMVDISEDFLYVWNIEQDSAVLSLSLAADYANGQRFIEGFRNCFLSWAHDCDREHVVELFKRIEESNECRFEVESQVHTGQGDCYWVNNLVRVKRNIDTQRAELVICAMRSLEQIKSFDAITGLAKYERCKIAFNNAKRNNAQYKAHFMLLGIDGFAAINTLNSHGFGDKVLRRVARDVSGMLSSKEVMYRFEGDQCLIAAENSSVDEMRWLYSRIKEYCAHPHTLDGRSYRITVSGGIISYPQECSTWVDLEKGITTALKKAKEYGKNQCVEFSQELLQEHISEQVLNLHLGESVGNSFKGFRAVFQPVCFTETLKIKGAETLLRFQGPDGHEVSPAEFIPLLENSRLILPVGLWVLEEAIKTCKAWVEYLPNFVMNVNASYIQLKDLDFCSKVEQLLAKYDLNARNLMIELTETHFVAGDEVINESLKRLKEMKIPLAMDDFGTGYSSIGQLAQFSVDLVKIDRSIVRTLHQNQYNRDLVESVIRICHNVGMRVCAEGVETREEQECVYLLNADCVQGFYVSKPLEKEDFYIQFVQKSHNVEDIVVDLGKEKMQKQLAGDKGLLRAMTNATPLCVVLWSRDMEMLSGNDEAVKLFGALSQKDLVENFFDFSPSVQPSGHLSSVRVREVLEPIFVSGRGTFTWMHCTRTGEEIPVEVTAVRLPYQDDYIVASYTRDLREQIATERKNQQFRLRLKALIDATPLCLNLWTKDIRNIMCNQEAVKLFDLSNEQEYLDRFYELSPEYQPDGQLSSDAPLIYIAEALEKGRKQFNWMHKKLTGELIPTEITLIRIDGLEDDGSDMVAGYTRDLRG